MRVLKGFVFACQGLCAGHRENISAKLMNFTVKRDFQTYFLTRFLSSTKNGNLVSLLKVINYRFSAARSSSAERVLLKHLTLFKYVVIYFLTFIHLQKRVNIISVKIK